MIRDTRKRTHPEDAEEPLVDGETSSTRKSKGRPRVNKQDETAADRRRTQIRLAQRAYRQRKESTIGALQSQVTSLQTTIDKLNEEFRKFNRILHGSAVFLQRQELVQELQSATDRFDLLVKASHHVSSALEGDSDRESAPDEVHTLTSLSNRPSAPSTSPDAADSQLLPLGYVQHYDEDVHEPHGSSRTPPEVTGIASELQSLSTGSSANMQPSMQLLAVSRANKPRPTNDALKISPMLTDPHYVYSSNESTFARRLHRAGLEKAYQLIGRSTTLPKLYKKTFQLTLLTHTHDQILLKARNALTKSIHDPLDLHRTPFFHLGGAGTHYGQQPKKNAYLIQHLGQGNEAKIFSMDDASDGGTVIELSLEDYDAIWFDPADVEAYLASLGVSIGPRENFAEAVIPEISPLGEILRSAGRLPVAPAKHLHQARSTTQEPAGNFSGQEAFPAIDLGFGDLSSFGNMTFASDASSWLMGGGDRMPDMMGPGGWSNMQFTETWNARDAGTPNVNRTITIDVGVFLDQVIKGGMCLGRSPGFQHKNVEKALVASIIEVV